jgi:hypothetical protein
MRTTIRTATCLFLSPAVIAAAACAAAAGDATALRSAERRHRRHLRAGPGADPRPSQRRRNSLPVTFVDGSGDHLVFLSGTRPRRRRDVRHEGAGEPSRATLELTDHGTYSMAGSSVTSS